MHLISKNNRVYDHSIEMHYIALAKKTQEKYVHMPL